MFIQVWTSLGSANSNIKEQKPIFKKELIIHMLTER